MLKSIDNYAFLVNFIATTVEIENFMEKVQLLGIDDITVRAMKLLQVLDTQIQLLKIKQEMNQKVKSDIDQQQREYYLNNQLRTIQEELGMDEEEEFEEVPRQGQDEEVGRRRSESSSRRSLPSLRSTIHPLRTTASSTTTSSSCSICLGARCQRTTST